jgi:hypothetical protein
VELIQNFSSKGLSKEMDLAESVDRSLLKGEAPQFSADFTHTLSCMSLFQFLWHLIEALGIHKIIAIFIAPYRN